MWSSNADTSATFEGGFLDNSRRGGQDDTKLRRQQNIIPVMIGHLLSVPSVDETKFWDVPARMFTVVGVIRNVEETATKLSYDIEDQTGTITAMKWLEADTKPLDQKKHTNTYARVAGLLREQNDKRYILIIRMSPLEDLNELTTHILEVTFATLKAEVLAQKNKSVIDHSAASNERPSEDSPYYGMTGDQTLVYKIIHAQNDTESGIERSDIKAQVPQRILSDMDNILEFLVSEGHIYTTSTDNHFKTT